MIIIYFLSLQELFLNDLLFLIKKNILLIDFSLSGPGYSTASNDTIKGTFLADCKVYKKIDSIELTYTYKVKDLETEEIIENNLLEGIVWRKGDEAYFSDDNVWQVTYYFNI